MSKVDVRSSIPFSCPRGASILSNSVFSMLWRICLLRWKNVCANILPSQQGNSGVVTLESQREACARRLVHVQYQTLSNTRRSCLHLLPRIPVRHQRRTFLDFFRMEGWWNANVLGDGRKFNIIGRFRETDSEDQHPRPVEKER